MLRPPFTTSMFFVDSLWSTDRCLFAGGVMFRCLLSVLPGEATYRKGHRSKDGTISQRPITRNHYEYVWGPTFFFFLRTPTPNANGPLLVVHVWMFWVANTAKNEYEHPTGGPAKYVRIGDVFDPPRIAVNMRRKRRRWVKRSWPTNKSNLGRHVVLVGGSTLFCSKIGPDQVRKEKQTPILRSICY